MSGEQAQAMAESVAAARAAQAAGSTMICRNCGKPLKRLPPISPSVYQGWPKVLPLVDAVLYHDSPHWQLRRMWCDWSNTTKAEI